MAFSGIKECGCAGCEGKSLLPGKGSRAVDGVFVGDNAEAEVDGGIIIADATRTRYSAEIHELLVDFEGAAIGVEEVGHNLGGLGSRATVVKIGEGDLLQDRPFEYFEYVGFAAGIAVFEGGEIAGVAGRPSGVAALAFVAGYALATGQASGADAAGATRGIAHEVVAGVERNAAVGAYKAFGADTFPFHTGSIVEADFGIAGVLFAAVNSQNQE